MEGFIRIKQIPETCKDCFLHSYAIGCRHKKRQYNGFKNARPDWCPIEVGTYHGWNITIENKEGFHDED